MAATTQSKYGTVYSSLMSQDSNFAAQLGIGLFFKVILIIEWWNVISLVVTVWGSICMATNPTWSSLKAI